jgi:hypothetical protein
MRDAVGYMVSADDSQISSQSNFEDVLVEESKSLRLTQQSTLAIETQSTI